MTTKDQLPPESISVDAFYSKANNQSRGLTGLLRTMPYDQPQRLFLVDGHQQASRCTAYAAAKRYGFRLSLRTIDGWVYGLKTKLEAQS